MHDDKYHKAEACEISNYSTSHIGPWQISADSDVLMRKLLAQHGTKFSL